jgi:hypothetical protein
VDRKSSHTDVRNGSKAEITAMRRHVRDSRKSGHGYDFLLSVVAVQMPAKTAISPTIRLIVIDSPTNYVASSPAAMGLTVIVFATRVGVARSSANTQRMKGAPPPTPR